MRAPRLLALLLLGLAAAPPLRADPAPRLAVTLAHETSGPTHIFVVEVATDLPDGARVEGSIAFVKKTREGEDQEIALATEIRRVERGKVSFRLGHFGREPYAGRYRGRAVVDPGGQPPGVLERLGADPAPLTAAAEIPFGDPAQFDLQTAAVKAELVADFKRLRALYRTLTPRLHALYALPEPQGKAWLEGRAAWIAEIDAIQARNRGRIGADIFWVEDYGKRYVDMLSEDLRQVEHAIALELDKPAAERRPLPALMADVNEFAIAQEMFMQNLGFVSVADAEGLAAALAGFRTLRDELAAWLARRRSADEAAAACRAWTVRRPALARELSAALARLSAKTSDLAFRDVARVTRDASALLAACDEAAARPPAESGAGVGAAADPLLAAIEAALARLDRIVHEGR